MQIMNGGGEGVGDTAQCEGVPSQRLCILPVKEEGVFSGVALDESLSKCEFPRHLRGVTKTQVQAYCQG